MDITFKSIINKHIFVEITCVDKNGDIIDSIEFYGRVIKADENESIIIENIETKEKFEMPPDLSSIRITKPSEYKINIKEQIVSNLDLIGKWTMKIKDITFKSIIGKNILVGMTYVDKKKRVIDSIEFYGKIIKADENKSIIIENIETKEKFELPPDLSSIKIAKPGEYKLRSTGKIIVNPDLITTWIVKRRNKKLNT